MKYICLGYLDPGTFGGMAVDERHAMFDECCEHNDHLRLCSGWIVGYPEVTCRGLPGITSVDAAITLQCVLLRPAPVTTRSQGDFWGGLSWSHFWRGGLLPKPRPAGLWGWCREGELNPQGAKHRRILSA